MGMTVDWGIVIGLFALVATGVGMYVGWRSDKDIKQRMESFVVVNRYQSAQVNGLIEEAKALTGVLNRMAGIVEMQLRMQQQGSER